MSFTRSPRKRRLSMHFGAYSIKSVFGECTQICVREHGFSQLSTVNPCSPTHICGRSSNTDFMELALEKHSVQVPSPTSNDEVEGDGLAAEAVDALADDDAGVAEADGADLEVASVQPEPLAPRPLDHPVVLQ